MKKYISYLVVCRLQLIALLFTGSLLLAQNNQNVENERVEEIAISYNTAFSYSMNSDISWELTSSKGELLNQGVGNLKNQIFKIPGSYTLSIHEKHNHTPGSCDHSFLPSKLNITVSPIKMVFDFSTVKFSKNITGGQSAKGIRLSVNADYSSSDNNTAVYNHGFATAGVGTSIIGNLKNNQIVLQPGINTLEFLLDGSAEKGNFIMIDFKDVNGQVQSYSLTQKIQ